MFPGVLWIAEICLFEYCTGERLGCLIAAQFSIDKTAGRSAGSTSRQRAAVVEAEGLFATEGFAEPFTGGVGALSGNYKRLCLRRVFETHPGSE